MKYEIETGYDCDGDPFVRIIYEDNNVLDDDTAMADVRAAVLKEWGPKASTGNAEGSSYFGPSGTEDGWEWTVKVPVKDVIKNDVEAADWCDFRLKNDIDIDDEGLSQCLLVVAESATWNRKDRRRLAQAIRDLYYTADDE